MLSLASLPPAKKVFTTPETLILKAWKPRACGFYDETGADREFRTLVTDVKGQRIHHYTISAK